MLVHERSLWKEIEENVEAVDAERLRTKISKEKSMRGKALYAPTEINRASNTSPVCKNFSEF